MNEKGEDLEDPFDPVEMYAREVSRVKPLTEEEEAGLFHQLGGSANWDENKESIARRLIENRLTLVLKIAKSYSGSGTPILELIQEGNLGLLAL